MNMPTIISLYSLELLDKLLSQNVKNELGRKHSELINCLRNRGERQLKNKHKVDYKISVITSLDMKVMCRPMQ